MSLDEVTATFPFARRSAFELPPEYARMRADQPVRQVVLRNGTKIWLVARFSDVREVLFSSRFSADVRRPGFPSLRGAVQETLKAMVRPNFMRMDDPEHARLRNMVSPYFTAKAIERMKPDIQHLVDGLVDELISAGSPTDIIDNLACRIPPTITSWILGVPPTDRAYFRQLTEKYMALDATRHDSRKLVADLEAYLNQLIDAKIEHPGDDVLSHVVRDHSMSETVDRDDLKATARLLLVAGHETTIGMIGMGLYALLSHPDQLRALHEDPSLIENAVEELLRYLTIVDQTTVRVATEDVELGGVLIRAGEAVLALTSSANRDSTVFDDPDRLNLRRGESRRHLAFGCGPHHCLGHLLAKTELQVIFATLTSRLPTIRLAVDPAAVQLRPNQLVACPDVLPVAW